MINKSGRLREMLEHGDIVQVAGAHDGMSAKLVESNGFSAVWASGFALSTCHAVPDASILTMTDYLHAARVMNYAVDIPVIADCDTGFGNSLNVSHMVKYYELAEIAAVCIEDKRFPKLNSFLGGGQDLELAEDFADKIAVGKRSQRGTDFVIIARTEAFIAGFDVNEALRRAHIYADAGADAILVQSKARTPEQVFTFLRGWNQRLPVVVVPTSYHQVTADELAEAGARMVIYANQAIRAGVRAMDETLREIRTSGTTTRVESRIAPMKELFELQGVREPTAREVGNGYYPAEHVSRTRL
ncbi:MAG: isocitrate lyase/phosphoenolpyruvate mutase family protein [Pseudonocardiaceae bacterium]